MIKIDQVEHYTVDVNGWYLIFDVELAHLLDDVDVTQSRPGLQCLRRQFRYRRWQEHTQVGRVASKNDI